MAIIVEEYDVFKGYNVGDIIEFERLATPTISSYRMGQSFIGKIAMVNDVRVISKVGYIAEWFPRAGIDLIGNMDWKPTWNTDGTFNKNVPNWMVKLRKFNQTQTTLPDTAVKVILGIVDSRDLYLYNNVNAIKVDTPSGEPAYPEGSSVKPKGN